MRKSLFILGVLFSISAGLLFADFSTLRKTPAEALFIEMLDVMEDRSLYRSELD